VRTFVDRYDELTAGSNKYGAEAQKAQELLATRGLTVDVINEAKALLKKLQQVAGPTEPISVETQEADLEAAETAMWGWYLEWSKIARVAIKQRALLKQLGFLSVKRGSDDEEEETEPTPATATPPAAPPLPANGTKAPVPAAAASAPAQ
jgi:hypothetical protein